MIFSCSMIEPGQPWETTSGSASWCGDRTWMKWMSSPSMLVTNCASVIQLRLAPPPVVFRRPVVRERLHRRELHTL
jgi:hypothetical protein